MKTIYKNIEPKKPNGQYHGYHQWGYANGGMIFRGIYKHDKPIGYHESHTMRLRTTFDIR
jgi:hypothetical protein